MSKIIGIPAQKKIGGRYGINIETLLGDKILTPNKDYMYQFFDEGGAARNITLSTNAKQGDRFIIKHTGAGDDANALTIKEGATTIEKIYAQVIKEFIFDGIEWAGESLGAYPIDNYEGIGIGDEANPQEDGVAIGYLTNAYVDGVAIGTGAKGSETGVGNYGIALGCSGYAPDMGVAVGYHAIGHRHGTACGYQADGALFSVACGYQADTNENLFSIALGYRSECIRHAELAINIDAETDQENNMMVCGWAGETTTNASSEIFCGGATSGKCFTIRPQSMLSFELMMNARDNVSNTCGTYMFEGAIKRDGANNTTLVTCSSMYIHEDNTDWDCVVSADDVNECLKVVVRGTSGNPTQWVGRLDGVETHF